MSRTNQYVISAPTGFTAASAHFKAALRDVHDKGLRGDLKMLDSLHEDGNKLVELTDTEVRALRAQHPGLVVEPNIQYKLLRQPFGTEHFEEIFIPTARSKPLVLQVVDAQSSRPVPRAEVTVVLDAGRGLVLRGTTDEHGNFTTAVRASTDVLDSVIVLPRSDYWGRRLRNVVVQGSEAVIPLSPLTTSPAEAIDWGHELTGLTDATTPLGEGVTIGVIDTGVRSDHEDIRPAGGRNCVFGEDPSRWFEDEDGHGTHCAGVIAALSNKVGVRGYVPKAQVRAYRVFGTGAEGASTFDIAKAIETAVADGCDILSMSLGSATPQTTLRAKLEAAFEKGVLCVAAAGNDGGPVGFPAAFPGVLAISAVGRFGTFPEDSLHKEWETGRVSADGRCFFAGFSNSGPEIAFCAPGVAIRSTVPGGYGVLDGTSMACPHITGLAALALSAHEEIRGMARDAARTEALIALLRSRARSLGLARDLEGAGCPTVAGVIAP